VWNEVWKTHGRMPKRGDQMENYKMKHVFPCSLGAPRRAKNGYQRQRYPRREPSPLRRASIGEAVGRLLSNRLAATGARGRGCKTPRSRRRSHPWLARPGVKEESAAAMYREVLPLVGGTCSTFLG